MELPSDMNGIAKTPATGQLFNINPDAKKNYQKKGTTVPSLGSKATIPMQRYTTRDSDHSCILMYQS